LLSGQHFDETFREWIEPIRIGDVPVQRSRVELCQHENLFQTGQSFYSLSQPAEAESQLREALRINPNHLKSRLLLGRILLEGGQLAQAVAILEETYKYDEAAARADLIKALLALADGQSEAEQLATYERVLNIQPDQPIASERRRAIWVTRGKNALQQNDFLNAMIAFKKAYENNEAVARTELIKVLLAMADGQSEPEQLSVYERVLSIDPNQLLAKERWRAIWMARGEAALNQDDLEKAQAAFQQAGNLGRIKQVEQLKHKRELIAQSVWFEGEQNWEAAIAIYEALLQEYPDEVELKARLKNACDQLKLQKLKTISRHEAKDDWEPAISIYKALLQEYPDEIELKTQLENAQTQAMLVQRYNDALNALKNGNTETAKRLLADVIAQKPDYKDSARFLLYVTTGVDVEELKRQLVVKKGAVELALAQNNNTQTKLDNKKEKKKSDSDNFAFGCLLIVMGILAVGAGYITHILSHSITTAIIVGVLTHIIEVVVLVRVAKTN